MQRRGVDFTAEDEALMLEVFEISKTYRKT